MAHTMQKLSPKKKYNRRYETLRTVLM